MNDFVRDEFLPALRSGEYQQSFDPDYYRVGDCYCFGGVAIDLIDGRWENAGGDYYDVPGDSKFWHANPEVAHALGITYSKFRVLVELNDRAHLTFPELADRLEKMLAEPATVAEEQAA